MEKYIGTKLIKAEPQIKDGRYGFRVIYKDGYESWSPKEVFEESYRRIDNLTFGLAIEALKKGYKVARKGWNGKGMFIYLVRGTLVEKDNLRNEAYNHLKDCESCGDGTGVVTINPHIDMKAADGTVVVGWLASQTDMLAEDYEIVG